VSSSYRDKKIVGVFVRFRAPLHYSAPKAVDPNKTLDDVDPELLEMYKKLGISVDEQK
jgi:Fe-S cluster assembly protein SufB